MLCPRYLRVWTGNCSCHTPWVACALSRVASGSGSWYLRDWPGGWHSLRLAPSVADRIHPQTLPLSSFAVYVMGNIPAWVLLIILVIPSLIQSVQHCQFPNQKLCHPDIYYPNIPFPEQEKRIEVLLPMMQQHIVFGSCNEAAAITQSRLRTTSAAIRFHPQILPYRKSGTPARKRGRIPDWLPPLLCPARL